MPEDPTAGTKYLWADTNSVVEIHGREKLSWTHLEEHLFKNSVPVEAHYWHQDRWTSTPTGSANTAYAGNRIILHVLSAEGDLKDISYVPTGSDFTPISDLVESYQPEGGEVFLIFSDFIFELSQDCFDFMIQNGFTQQQLNPLFEVKGYKLDL